MSSATPTAEIKQRLAELIEQIRRSDGLRPAAAVLRESARTVGMTHVAVVVDASHPNAPVDEEGESLVELLGWSREFIDDWLARNYSGRSAGMMQARVKHLPFAWSPADLLTDRGSAPNSAAALMRLGISACVVAPIRLPRGRFGVVTWMGPGDTPAAVELADAFGPEFLLLAHYYLEHARERLDPPPVIEDMARLSPRELQCLTLVARGCSDNEAGVAADLTPRTVRFHLQNAIAKLGARSRSHAVALGTQLGILGPIF